MMNILESRSRVIKRVDFEKRLDQLEQESAARGDRPA